MDQSHRSKDAHLKKEKGQNHLQKREAPPHLRTTLPRAETTREASSSPLRNRRVWLETRPNPRGPKWRRASTRFLERRRVTLPSSPKGTRRSVSEETRSPALGGCVLRTNSDPPRLMASCRARWRSPTTSSLTANTDIRSSWRRAAGRRVASPSPRRARTDIISTMVKPEGGRKRTRVSCMDGRSPSS
jgi:hypothetical protein